MGLLPLFIQPFRRLRLPPSESFSSQTVLITGANSGLGLETARHVVNLGASKVILGVRTLAKGEAAKIDIEATTGRIGVIEVWQVDLERFDSVEAFVARAALLERLDVAIMNAGLASLQWNLYVVRASSISIFHLSEDPESICSQQALDTLVDESELTLRLLQESRGV